MIAERYIPRPAGEQMEDESIEAFVVRRFGKQAYRRIAEPVLGGLYTGDTQTMSLELAMPRFRDLERRFGSVTRGLAASTKGCPVGGSAVEGFFTLRGGLESLVERLAARLPAGTVRLGQGVRRVAFDPGHGLWAVETEDETLPALAVILACPSHRAAAVVRELDPELAAWFDEFEYASCATVNLIYRRADVGAGLDRFGFFVPRGEKLPILGASVVSAKFPGRVHEDHVLVRTFMGGALAPQLLARDDAELIALSDGALRKLLSITDAPVETRVHRLPRSMPQFQVGAAARLGVIHDRIAAHRGLYLCGTAGGVIGLPDCIRSGETVAQTALEAVGPHALAETERNLPAAHLR